jgi:hypothetical protein
MTWQKALFFGGAILLLTGCSSATAPTEPAQLKVTKASASFNALGDSSSTQSGYYVRSGSVNIPIGPVAGLPGIQ